MFYPTTPNNSLIVTPEWENTKDEILFHLIWKIKAFDVDNFQIFIRKWMQQVMR